MVIALMSDLHDNVVAWNSIVAMLKQMKIERLINCGDTCAPDMLKDMATTFSGQIDTVYGNVADRELEMSVVKTLNNVTHYGDAGTIEIDEKKIFFNHFPKEAEAAAKTGNYDLVCHGHTHLKRWEPFDKLRANIHQCMILNPGTAGGMFQYPSFAILNLQTMQCSFIDITL